MIRSLYKVGGEWKIKNIVGTIPQQVISVIRTQSEMYG
jgi:hypothetical protein